MVAEYILNYEKKENSGQRKTIAIITTTYWVLTIYQNYTECLKTVSTIRESIYQVFNTYHFIHGTTLWVRYHFLLCSPNENTDRIASTFPRSHELESVQSDKKAKRGWLQRLCPLVTSPVHSHLPTDLHLNRGMSYSSYFKDRQMEVDTK